MTDKIRNLLEDVQTVYEGKGMVVHPNSFDKLRMEVIKLDNINRLQGEQIEKMKQELDTAREEANRQEQWELYSVLNGIYNDNFEVTTSVSN